MIFFTGAVCGVFSAVSAVGSEVVGSDAAASAVSSAGTSFTASFSFLRATFFSYADLLNFTTLGSFFAAGDLFSCVSTAAVSAIGSAVFAVSFF
ncbi:hypothetical protein D3C80_1785750 [compost metagenome]